MNLDEALIVVEATLSALRDGVANGEDIFIRGFGTFKIVTTKAKTGRDIGRKTFVSIPARKSVKLILCKELKDKLNSAK